MSPRRLLPLLVALFAVGPEGRAQSLVCATTDDDCTPALADHSGAQAGLTEIALPDGLDCGAGTQAVAIAVSLLHDRIGDLHLEVVDPRGGLHPLLDGLEGPLGRCNGDDLDVRFAAGGAAARCGDGIPAVSGTVAPTSTLAYAPAPGANGAWTLRVFDLVVGGYGRLRGWHVDCIQGDLAFADGFE